MKTLFSLISALSLFVSYPSYVMASASNEDKVNLKNNGVKGQFKKSLSRYEKVKYSDDFKNFDYVNPNAPKGGSLTLASYGTFDSLNPDSIHSINKEPSIILTFDTLFKRSADEPFSLYPLIAESAMVAPDSSYVIVKINPKARFHDNSPITAHDVGFSAKYLSKQGSVPQRNYYSKIKNIDVIDDSTVKFSFEKDDKGNYNKELPLIVCGFMRILSKKAMENIDYQNYTKEPILGSGPYRVKEFKFGDYIIYERVLDYWAKDLPVNKGCYNYDVIRINYYKNAKAQFQAFLAKEFDFFAETDLYQWTHGYNVPAVTQGKLVKIEKKHDCPVTVRTLAFNLRVPLFQDIRVRKALTLAFDFDMINKLCFEGTYLPMTSLFANTILAHSGSASDKEKEILKPFEKDLSAEVYEGFKPQVAKTLVEKRENLKKADELLTQAGYVLKNNLRVHEKSGTPLVIEFMYKDASLEKIILFYKTKLAKLGIALKPIFLSTSDYEKRVFNREFDMIVHARTNNLSPGNEQILYFTPPQPNEKGGSNYESVNSPALEAIAKKIPMLSSYEELKDHVHALDRVFMGMYYSIPFAYSNTYYGAYWKDRLALPTYNPKVGINVPVFGYSAAPVQNSKK